MTAASECEPPVRSIVNLGRMSGDTEMIELADESRLRIWIDPQPPTIVRKVSLNRGEKLVAKERDLATVLRH